MSNRIMDRAEWLQARAELLDKDRSQLVIYGYFDLLPKGRAW